MLEVVSCSRAAQHVLCTFYKPVSQCDNSLKLAAGLTALNGGVNCHLRLFKLHLVPGKQLLPLLPPSLKVLYQCSQGVSLHCSNVHDVRAALDALTL